MPPQGGHPPPADEAQLSPDRCPICDRPLRQAAGQAEPYCPNCGIIVEVLLAPAPTPSDTTAPPDNETRLRTARLYLEMDEILGEEPTAPPPESTMPEAKPEPARDEEKSTLAPAVIPVVEEAPPTMPGQGGRTEAAPEEAAVAGLPEIARPARPVPRPWHRVLFYAGSLLIAFGGSGLALGSLFHDVFRVPFFGFAYDVFGQVNVSVAEVGAIILLGGVAAMAVGARAGSRPRRATEA